MISASKFIRIDFFLSVGIMAILFSGIVMSHYTHHNLSPVTQILMQQTLRTMAFMCGEFLTNLLLHRGDLLLTLTLLFLFVFDSTETCVFAFLGLSIFSFPHKFELSFVIWCIVSACFHLSVSFQSIMALSALQYLIKHECLLKV